MTVLSIAAVSSLATPARAEAPAPPAPLIHRALRYAGLDGRDTVGSGTLMASRWLPSVHLGASVERAQLATGAREETVVYGALTWPLDYAAVGAARDELRNDRWRLQARDDLVERITAAWHRRADAERVRDEIAGELDLEEADAELDALTGDALGERP